MPMTDSHSWKLNATFDADPQITDASSDRREYFASVIAHLTDYVRTRGTFYVKGASF